MSSLQGPCFYPAGNLWHYLPVYYLHMATTDAEYIMKYVHFLVHSIIIVLMSKTAFRYFKGEPLRAQLLTFIWLCCERDRELYQLMFNDEIMGMYLVIALYLIGV